LVGFVEKSEIPIFLMEDFFSAEWKEEGKVLIEFIETGSMKMG
jgi:hypothetical protein